MKRRVILRMAEYATILTRTTGARRDRAEQDRRNCTTCHASRALPSGGAGFSGADPVGVPW